jgi:hypothetical protein
LNGALAAEAVVSDGSDFVQLVLSFFETSTDIFPKATQGQIAKLLDRCGFCPQPAA